MIPLQLSPLIKPARSFYLGDSKLQGPAWDPEERLEGAETT